MAGWAMLQKKFPGCGIQAPSGLQVFYTGRLRRAMDPPHVMVEAWEQDGLMMAVSSWEEGPRWR